jgi:hypothetical protein
MQSILNSGMFPAEFREFHDCISASFYPLPRGSVEPEIWLQRVAASIQVIRSCRSWSQSMVVLAIPWILSNIPASQDLFSIRCSSDVAEPLIQNSVQAFKWLAEILGPTLSSLYLSAELHAYFEANSDLIPISSSSSADDVRKSFVQLRILGTLCSASFASLVFRQFGVEVFADLYLPFMTNNLCSQQIAKQFDWSEFDVNSSLDTRHHDLSDGSNFKSLILSCKIAQEELRFSVASVLLSIALSRKSSSISDENLLNLASLSVHWKSLCSWISTFQKRNICTIPDLVGLKRTSNLDSQPKSWPLEITPWDGIPVELSFRRIIVPILSFVNSSQFSVHVGETSPRVDKIASYCIVEFLNHFINQSHMHQSAPAMLSSVFRCVSGTLNNFLIHETDSSGSAVYMSLYFAHQILQRLDENTVPVFIRFFWTSEVLSRCMNVSLSSDLHFNNLIVAISVSIFSQFIVFFDSPLFIDQFLLHASSIFNKLTSVLSWNDETKFPGLVGSLRGISEMIKSSVPSEQLMIYLPALKDFESTFPGGLVSRSNTRFPLSPAAAQFVFLPLKESVMDAWVLESSSLRDACRVAVPISHVVAVDTPIIDKDVIEDFKYDAQTDSVTEENAEIEIQTSEMLVADFQPPDQSVDADVMSSSIQYSEGSSSDGSSAGFVAQLTLASEQYQSNLQASLLSFADLGSELCIAFISCL